MLWRRARQAKNGVGGRAARRWSGCTEVGREGENSQISPPASNERVAPTRASTGGSIGRGHDLSLSEAFKRWMPPNPLRHRSIFLLWMVCCVYSLKCTYEAINGQTGEVLLFTLLS